MNTIIQTEVPKLSAKDQDLVYKWIGMAELMDLPNDVKTEVIKALHNCLETGIPEIPADVLRLFDQSVKRSKDKQQ